MKKIFLILLSVSIVSLSCSSDDDSTPIDPSNFATATVNYNGPSSVAENAGSVDVDISLSKPSAANTSFTITQVGGTAEEGVDYTLTNVPVASFTTSGVLTVNVINSPFPKPDRTLLLEVSTPEFGAELLNSSSNVPYSISLTITDVNPTDGLTVGYDWNEDQASDLDLTVFYEDGTEVAILATADVPEIGPSLILNTDPDGTYYIDMQPYDFSELQIDYNFGIAKPNGEVVELTGTFDFTNIGNYETDESGALGATAYRLVKVVKSGSNYTITSLN